MVAQNVAALAVLLGARARAHRGRGPERAQAGGADDRAGHPLRSADAAPRTSSSPRPASNRRTATSSPRARPSSRSSNLTAQGGFEGLALQSLFSPASTFYTAAFSLAQPIFDGGLLQGQFDQQKGVQDQLVAQYKKAVVTAFSDVDKALSALKLYAEQEELTRQSLAASRKAFQLSQDRLKQGVLDVVTLLQTEQTLFTTQDTLIQVRLLRFTEAIALYQALGGAYAGEARGAKGTSKGGT